MRGWGRVLPPALAAAAFALAGPAGSAGSTGAREAPSAGPAPPAQDELRVLVLNLHAGHDAGGRDNLERAADLIRRREADLVLLQEVDRETERAGGVDQTDWLARATGLHGAFGGTMPFQGGEYGLAVLSRWPIAARELVPLPAPPAGERPGDGYEPRGVLRVTLTTPRGELHVLNTHLDASPRDVHRRREISAVLELAERLRAGGSPVLLGGDLNAPPDSRVIDDLRRAGWTDAWRACGQGEGSTFPADAPERRIDYLFLPPELSCRGSEVLKTRLSDHRPLWVRVAPASVTDAGARALQGRSATGAGRGAGAGRAR